MRPSLASTFSCISLEYLKDLWVTTQTLCTDGESPSDLILAEIGVLSVLLILLIASTPHMSFGIWWRSIICGTESRTSFWGVDVWGPCSNDYEFIFKRSPTLLPDSFISLALPKCQKKLVFPKLFDSESLCRYPFFLDSLPDSRLVPFPPNNSNEEGLLLIIQCVNWDESDVLSQWGEKFNRLFLLPFQLRLERHLLPPR